MQYKTQLKEVKKEPKMLSLSGVQIMWKVFIRNLKVTVRLRKPPLVFPRNDLWGTIWVVPLIG